MLQFWDLIFISTLRLGKLSRALENVLDKERFVRFFSFLQFFYLFQCLMIVIKTSWAK